MNNFTDDENQAEYLLQTHWLTPFRGEDWPPAVVMYARTLLYHGCRIMSRGFEEKTSGKSRCNRFQACRCALNRACQFFLFVKMH